MVYGIYYVYKLYIYIILYGIYYVYKLYKLYNVSYSMAVLYLKYEQNMYKTKWNRTIHDSLSANAPHFRSANLTVFVCMLAVHKCIEKVNISILKKCFSDYYIKLSKSLYYYYYCIGNPYRHQYYYFLSFKISLIGRAGASPPSRTAAIIFLYIIYIYPCRTSCPKSSTCFFFSDISIFLGRVSFSPIFLTCMPYGHMAMDSSASP